MQIDLLSNTACNASVCLHSGQKGAHHDFSPLSIGCTPIELPIDRFQSVNWRSLSSAACKAAMTDPTVKFCNGTLSNVRRQRGSQCEILEWHPVQLAGKCLEGINEISLLQCPVHKFDSPFLEKFAWCSSGHLGSKFRTLWWTFTYSRLPVRCKVSTNLD